MVLPQEVIQGAWTGSWLRVNLIIPSIPANRVFSEAQELLFVTQHAAVIRVTDVVRVGQPLHVILIVTYKHKQILTSDQNMRETFIIWHQKWSGVTYSLWWGDPWSRWWRRPSTGLRSCFCSPRCWPSWSELLVLMPDHWSRLGLRWSCAHSNTALHQWKICQDTKRTFYTIFLLFSVYKNVL